MLEMEGKRCLESFRDKPDVRVLIATEHTNKRRIAADLKQGRRRPSFRQS
jgi:hypothetical protein